MSGVLDFLVVFLQNTEFYALVCDLYDLERLKTYGRSDVRLGGNQKLNCLRAVERLLCYIFYVICVCVLREMSPREGN